MVTPTSPPGFAEGGFHTTRWTLVVAAGAAASPAAQQALADLCRLYWYPLYAYIRRRGYPHVQAEDLTQDFFARLLEKKDLARVQPQRGRFRAFLLTACQHFLANEWDRINAHKRGGGKAVLPLNFSEAEDRYEREPSHEETPERLFERRWVLTLLQQVLARLRTEYVDAGKGSLFEMIRGCLTAENQQSYAEIAQTVNSSEGAIKVAVHRLRQRYRELLRDEIGQTVAGPEQIDEEIRALFATLSG